LINFKIVGIAFGIGAGSLSLWLSTWQQLL